MKNQFLLSFIILLMVGMLSCELANVYRPSEVESAAILESVQEFFLPVAYKKAQLINDDSESKMITEIEEESDNGLSIEGTRKDGDDAEGHFNITEITLAANNLEIENSDISKLNGSIDFTITISKNKKATNNYQGDLTIIYKGNELQLTLDIRSEIDLEEKTIEATGTYQIRDREYDYSYDGDDTFLDETPE